MTDPVIRAAQRVAWGDGYSYSQSHLECDAPWDSGETCDGCPTCKPVNPYEGPVTPDDYEITANAAAARDVLAQFVRSPDTMRRLTHMVRLAEMNGHDDTADTMRLIADLGIRTHTIYAHKLIRGMS